MGITSKKGKAPVGLPTVNMLDNPFQNGTSKATKAAKTQAKENARMAARRAKINAKAGIVVQVEAMPKTTKGATRASGGSPAILSNKSTVYKATLAHSLNAVVRGKKVTLGRRDTYQAEDKARIEAEELKAGPKQTGYVYGSRYGSEHHKIKSDRTITSELSRDRSCSVNINKK